MGACRGAARRLRPGLALGVLLVPLAAASLASGEETPFDAIAHRSFALVAPLIVDDEPSVAAEPSHAGSRIAAGGGRSLQYTLTAADPKETAPIPYQGAPSSEPTPWPYDLPFLADKALERGYTLPLPRGVSFIYTYVERKVKIDTVKIGVDGAPLRDVTDFVNLGSTSRVHVALARFDAWLLPFLNVYAMAGYVSNNTTTRGVVTIPPLRPRGEPRTFNLTKTTDLDGFVGGVGLTGAAGWRDFFLVADFNFSQTDIGFDDPFRAYIGTIRTGWNGAVFGIPLRLWGGGSYWGTRGTAKATVDVPDVGVVSFSALQGPLHPLNALVGGNVTFFKRWELFLEYGFNFDDVQIAAAGLSFRF